MKYAIYHAPAWEDLDCSWGFVRESFELLSVCCRFFPRFLMRSPVDEGQPFIQDLPGRNNAVSCVKKNKRRGLMFVSVSKNKNIVKSLMSSQSHLSEKSTRMSYMLKGNYRIKEFKTNHGALTKLTYSRSFDFLNLLLKCVTAFHIGVTMA